MRTILVVSKPSVTVAITPAVIIATLLTVMPVIPTPHGVLAKAVRLKN
jgi:hypothetical protein